MAQPTKELDMFIKFTLGAQRDPIVIQTRVFPKQNKFPDFGNELVELDIPNPQQCMLNGELPMTVQVFRQDRFGAELLGETTVSTLPYFEGGELDIELNLKWTYPATGEKQKAGMLDLKVEFEPVRQGIIVITAYNGRQMKNMDRFGQQDPYVYYFKWAKVESDKIDSYVTCAHHGESHLLPICSVFSYCVFKFGEDKKKGRVCHQGGSAPFFGEEEFEFWVDGAAWGENMILECWDKDLTADDFIGGCSFPILEFLQLPPERRVKRWLQLKDKRGLEDRGQVELSFEFFPAGKLRIRPKGARRLFNADLARQDPYVEITIENKLTKLQQKTETDRDGGTEPVWEDVLTFNIVNQYELQLAVYNRNFGGVAKVFDDLIGKTKVSLLPYFQRGYIDEWIPIFNKKKGWGERQDMGEVQVEIDFTGPEGVAYPQRQDLIDSFDHRERKTYSDIARQKAEEDAAQQARREMQQSAVISATHGVTDVEFTDKEIYDAFRFIDLDKNFFIGSAEIRHILVCMGEMVTDEEIDMMIQMCDLDGDGQVSYEEFYRLARHPDPSRADFSDAVARALQPTSLPGTGVFEGGVPPPPPSGPPGLPQEEIKAGMPPERASRGAPGALSKTELSTAERQRQMMRKAEKRKLLQKFKNDNSSDMDFMEMAWKRFQSVEKSGKIKFENFIKLLGVEPTGEIKRLFHLFDNDKSGSIDIKEFLLGLSNFASDDKQKKVKFCFDLYDADRNGFITEEELIQVLKANHMATNEAQVIRKAKTIM